MKSHDTTAYLPRAGGQRITRRIEILLKIFESEDPFGKRLLQMLKEEVTAAVSDKETTIMVNAHKREWIEKLSIDSIHMKEGYTFQKSVWLHLLEKVSPIVSRIIEFCDVDSGLDLVEEGAASEWAREVFLEVLALARKAGDGFISLSDLRSNLGRISSNLTGFATEYWTNWSKLD